MADRGTLFLDEIGEMPGELQVKLLRLLQQGELEKVGAASSLKVDVRFVAATHRNLRAMIEDGTFREDQDLYYRLAVIPLELPPLRDPTEDIPELVEHFFLKIREKQGRQDLVLPPALLPRFQDYRWPGNVRELENQGPQPRIGGKRTAHQSAREIQRQSDSSCQIPGHQPQGSDPSYGEVRDSKEDR